MTAPAVSLDLGFDRAATLRKPRASRTTHVSELSQPRSKPRAHRQSLPTLDQNATGCSCGLIRARGGLSDERRRPSGADVGAASASVKSETHGAFALARRTQAPALLQSRNSDVDEPDMSQDPEEDDGGGSANLASSEESLSPDSLAPSSLSTIRSRLFASDDEEEDDLGGGEDEVGSALSSWSGWSPSSCFLPSASPAKGASPPLPPRRASLSSTAATSDPLRHWLFSSPPKLEFDRVRQRAHWLPAPSHPTAETAWSAPDVPDVVRSSLAATSSPIHTPPNSPPRAASSTSPTRPESLLTKSLRSLSRLPNLTLADVLPRATSTTTASVDDDEDLAALPPGWGPAERRRVLAEEPSHAADEARAGFRYLLRRPASPFSLTGRSKFSSSTSSASSSSSSDFGGYAIDEVEALGYGFGFGLKDLGDSSSSSSSSERDPPSSLAAAAASSVEDKAEVYVEAPTSPSADVPPLPPRPHERTQVPVTPHAVDIPDVAASARPSSPDQEEEEEASSPLCPTPQPQPVPPRFVSNHRHLLMLALEFEMMRHAKIRGPLRQRAVIVRQATSPPRERGMARERSRLCQEVVEA